MLKEHKDNIINWGLPGGKLEKHEGYLKAAQREFYEECGLNIDEKHFIEIHSCEINFQDSMWRGKYFLIINFKGNPIIGEPEKNIEVKFLNSKEILKVKTEMYSVFFDQINFCLNLLIKNRLI